MKYFKRTDFIIIVSIIAISLVFLFIYTKINKDRPATAQIFYHSTMVAEIDLTEKVDKDYVVEGHENVTFHIYPDGSIAFIESDCPDQVCVRTGKLSLNGQTSACLPNGMVVKIVAKSKLKEDDFDLVV